MVGDGETPLSVVRRWLDGFDGGVPDEATVDRLLARDCVFVERPNLVNPQGSERDRAAIAAGLRAGRELLRTQRYDVLGTVVEGDTVVVRMRWTGELAIAAGPWPAGTTLSAWCCGHYEVRDGRIRRIEQQDCYDPVTV